MKTYTDSDLAPYTVHLSTARAMADEDSKTVHDEGTCVLGAGIAVWYKAPRKRTGTHKVLVRAPFQGNVAQYKACKRALEYLQSQMLDVFWYDGVMD